ncbi:MAG: hypothetical protein WDN72_06975 [Alphaproteobacteria bacterium]
MTSIVERIWQRQQKLWKVFWIGLPIFVVLEIGGGIVGGIILQLQGHGYYMDDPAKRQLIVNAILTNPLWIAITLGYCAVWTVCVWRCARNTRHKIWGYLARIAVVLFLLWCLLGGLYGVTNRDELLNPDSADQAGNSSGPLTEGGVSQ